MLVEIQGESMNGVMTWMVHSRQPAAASSVLPMAILRRTHPFLTPFDSLPRAGDRDEKLWGFEQLLECYKPACGACLWVFCLPIPAQGSAGGPLDPKLDRKSGVLHLNALYLEPGIEPDDELSPGSPMHADFLHGMAPEPHDGDSDPPAFGDKLMLGPVESHSANPSRRPVAPGRPARPASSSCLAGCRGEARAGEKGRSVSSIHRRQHRRRFGDQILDHKAAHGLAPHLHFPQQIWRSFQ